MASDLIFTVKANTSSAAASFKKLSSSILPIKKESDDAAKAMAKLGKTKVQPKIDDKQIHKVTEEIKRLQAEMAHRLSLNVNANTADIRRKITGLRSTLKELQRAQPAITPRITTGPITRGLASIKSKFSDLRASAANTRLGAFAQRAVSDFQTLGGMLGGLATKLGQFGSAMGQIVGNIGVPVLGAALGAVTALGIGLGVTTVKALGLADEMERTTIQINSFVRNTGKTNKLLKQVQAYADTTPFEFPELALASKMLLGLGKSTSQVIPTLKAIGDVASQSGASVQQLTTIYAQMMSAGRLNAGDMNQLVNAGVNAWPVLAKSMGKTVAEVRKLSEQGKIGTKDIQKFWDTLAKGAAGSTTALGQTLGGMISTLKDTMNGVLRDIGNAILPFAKVIVPQLTKATQGLGGKIAAQIPGWIDTVAEGAKALIDAGGRLLGGLKGLTVGIISGISGFQAAIGQMSTSFGSVLTQLALGLSAIPGMKGIAQSLADAGSGLILAGGNMEAASKTTAAAAVEAGKQWDKWITEYNRGADRAKAAISGAQLKSALVISTGKAQTQVDKLKAKLDKIDGTRAHPIVNADTKEAAAKLKTAEGWLKQLNAYEANPKLLAKDLASGKVKYVKGQLQSVPKSHNTNINAKDKTKAPTNSAKGNVQDVPKSHNTNLTATDNASGKANHVEAAIKAIPHSWSTTFTLDYHTNYSSSGNPSGFSPSKVPSSIQAPLSVAAPQVSLTVRDEKLADLIDIRVNQRVARAHRIIRRRGVVAL